LVPGRIEITRPLEFWIFYATPDAVARNIVRIGCHDRTVDPAKLCEGSRHVFEIGVSVLLVFHDASQWIICVFRVAVVKAAGPNILCSS
jgi:hypothetical protein